MKVKFAIARCCCTVVQIPTILASGPNTPSSPAGVWRFRLEDLEIGLVATTDYISEGNTEVTRDANTRDFVHNDWDIDYSNGDVWYLAGTGATTRLTKGEFGQVGLNTDVFTIGQFTSTFNVVHSIGKVYWAEETAEKPAIKRADLDGTNEETIYDSYTATDDYIAQILVDETTEDVYVMNFRQTGFKPQKIQKITSAGVLEPDLTTYQNIPLAAKHISLDQENGFIWVTVQNTSTGQYRIERLGTDGAGPVTIIPFQTLPTLHRYGGAVRSHKTGNLYFYREHFDSGVRDDDKSGMYRTDDNGANLVQLTARSDARWTATPWNGTDVTSLRLWDGLEDGTEFVAI